MELTVELSERARRDIEQIADYLSKNWSERTKIEFLILLTEQMKLISTMPYLYKASQKQFSIRECVMINTPFCIIAYWKKLLKSLRFVILDRNLKSSKIYKTEKAVRFTAFSVEIH